jgi:O-6-methylguanine DNA methyltransferase
VKQGKRKAGDFFDILRAPFGTIYLVFTGSRLSGISFVRPDDLVFRDSEDRSPLKRELSEYLEKGRTEFTGSTVFLEGTEFEQRIWQALREIPYGETRTYKWLAGCVGRPNAFRAAGNALAKNPIPIIFPCHRIIDSDGSLGGYTPGIDIKRRLLEMEYYVSRSAESRGKG